MATEDTPSFDDLEPVQTADFDDDEAEWIDFEEGEIVTGDVVAVKENCGENDSRVYKLKTEVGHPPVLLWGKASINRQFDAADLGPGDYIGIKHTGETFETDSGYEGVVYDVRAL